MLICSAIELTHPTPSGKTVGSTLGGRIGGNHLRGTIRGSTFRRTLAAALWRSLGLEIAGPARLTRAAEQELSTWMLAHLEVAVHPFAKADALGDLERRVLAVLDPPLNLDGNAEHTSTHRVGAAAPGGNPRRPVVVSASLGHDLTVAMRDYWWAKYGWATRRSKLQTQLYVNGQPEALTAGVLEAIPALREREPSLEWVVPLEKSISPEVKAFAEPRDGRMLAAQQPA